MADEEILEEEVVTPAAAPAPVQLDDWGDVIQGRPDVAAGADLGRAYDATFLGDAAQDPVGSGVDTAQEILRTGDLGGYDLDAIRKAQSPMSEFPLEPGESRAAQELPEMFIGKKVMNPAYEDLSNRLENPDLTFFERMGLMMSLKEMEGSETQQAGSGMGEGMSLKDKALISAAALTMFDPAEVAQMLMQVDPETGERRWPQFAMQHAPDGTIVMTNTLNGAKSMINAPGMSKMDLIQGLGITAAFTPAGKATSAMAGTAGRIAVGATTAGATEAVIQQGQEMAGGQFDAGDVALSTAVGPIIDVARPAMGLLQRSGKFIGSYLPENMFGGLSGILPEVKAQALNFAKKGKEFLQSGRPAIITTQDAVPESHTPFRMILLKMVERLPLTGTGALRLREKQQRIEVLQWIGDRYNLSPNTNYGATVIRELNANKGQQLTAARNSINTAIDTMQDQKVNIRDFRFKVRDIIEAEQEFGTMANQGVVDLLNKVRNAVWQGGKKQDFGRGFGTISDWLDRLRLEARNAGPQARATLNEAADALEADLVRTANESGGAAGQRWIKGTQQVNALVKDAETKSLRSLIESGKIDQQVIRKVLKEGDPEDLRLLYNNMGPQGVTAARQMIMRNAMKVGGWRRGPAGEAVVDPDKVLRWLDSDAVDKQITAFFPDEAARNELNGMREYLRMTDYVKNLGEGVGMAASGGIPQQGANALNLITLGLVGALGHAYQGAPVRNLLLRLYHVKDNVRAKDAIMEEITPLLMAGGRQMMQEWASDDPQDSVYVSDEFAEAQAESGDTGVMDQTMNQLRTAVGAEEDDEEGPGLTQRLMEMLGMGADEEQEAEQ